MVKQYYDENKSLKHLIKWPGGKEKELKFIFPNVPENINNYYEPFVGGASVFMAFNAENFFINDKSSELINLYKYIAANDKGFYDWARAIETAWTNMLFFAKKSNLENIFMQFRNDEIDEEELKKNVQEYLDSNKENVLNVLPKKFIEFSDILFSETRINLTRKLQRMKKIEQGKCILPENDIKKNIETAFMSALYMYFRFLYNDNEIKSNTPFHTALFLFIRNYTYSGMFRYNDKGDFNVPYGGMGYNEKSLENKLKYYQSQCVLKKFATTKIENMDFEDFFKQNVPEKDDFVFLDPPYDSEFSTYAQNDFTKDEQKRLANYLCNECKGKWMLVIKATPFILSLYKDKGLNIKSFHKTYTVSFMNRNDKKAEHLIIMNYENKDIIN